MNTYEKTRALFDRAAQVIPGGIPGHMGPVLSQFIPVDAYPFYSKRARGSYFWDYDDNRFIDYMCAYGPNVLGYNDPTVDAAAHAQKEDGNCMPLPAAAQVELAETLVDTIAGADWAFFAKNGNDVTSLAVMTARAATGRSKLVMVKGGYHGVAPWTQAAGHAGLTCEDTANNLFVSWNDFDELERTFNEHKGEIACFMATPYHHPIFTTNELPAEGYWQKVRKLCDDHGVVLAIDYVRVGFRLNLAGSANYFGFEPDL
ncbi:MAG: aminotransferase class III-fold pyridoxal phosphate-dependent enzyme, partial [Gammaproteobacteria bacterium]|nr:aminotransferase class III-fold pyridoxal phosphate-dependent enzyme [Gammaproteobacteria bacterium]